MLHLFVAAAAAASGFAAQAPTPPPLPALRRAMTAAEIAAAMTPRLPQTFRPGEVLTRAVAEGRTMILTVELSAELAAADPPGTIARRYAASFCASSLADALFRSGGSLRVDTKVSGAAAPATPGPLLTSCAGFAPLPPPSRSN